jgi:hypothetical protein
MACRVHANGIYLKPGLVHILNLCLFGGFSLRREQFVQWTEKLPDSQSPSWLGLPNNAEKLLLTVQGN